MGGKGLRERPNLLAYSTNIGITVRYGKSFTRKNRIGGRRERSRELRSKRMLGPRAVGSPTSMAWGKNLANLKKGGVK